MTMDTKTNNNNRDQAFKELISKISNWNIPEESLDNIHDLAKQSMTEVKSLTEYEDGKVSRILTIIAFLSAVVAAVFTRFSSSYEYPNIDNFVFKLDFLLPLFTYIAFFTYVVIVTFSVLMVIRAITPQFNTPKSWSGTARDGLPGSMIFYNRILDVTAPRWGECFIELSKNEGKDAKKYYTKCYIQEAYLIAEKVADKLERVSRGINLLRFAMYALIAFLCLFGFTTLLVKPTIP